MAVSALRPVRRRTTMLAKAAVLVVAILGTALGTASVAVATPAPTSTDLTAEIDQEWIQLEPTIENYDAVHEKFLEQQAKANALEAQIAPLALSVQVTLARVGGIAAHVYEAGPNTTMQTILNASGSANAINVLGTIEEVADSRHRQVQAAVKLQKQYEAKKKPIDALVASLSTQQSALNAQKAIITTKINALDAQRRAAYGGDGRAGGSLEPVACPYTYNGDAGSKAALFACKQIGKPYVWDAAGPKSYDCSGLTMAAWASVKVYMPHNAYAQKHTIQAVSQSQLHPGDLVFYYPGISHVTIYVGGIWAVSAPTSGDVVRMVHYNYTSPVGYGRPS